MGIINLQGVTKIYQTKEVETVALENVNLEVKAGEFLSVMGPSGCGKSTMLNLIGLLDVPTEGRRHGGRRRHGPDERRRNGGVPK